MVYPTLAPKCIPLSHISTYPPFSLYLHRSIMICEKNLSLNYFTRPTCFNVKNIQCIMTNTFVSKKQQKWFIRPWPPNASPAPYRYISPLYPRLRLPISATFMWRWASDLCTRAEGIRARARWEHLSVFHGPPLSQHVPTLPLPSTMLKYIALTLGKMITIHFGGSILRSCPILVKLSSNYETLACLFTLKGHLSFKF